MWWEWKAHGIRQTLKRLRLEQDRKGMNKRIWAALRLKMEGIEHELHKMGWHLTRIKRTDTWRDDQRNASERIERMEWRERMSEQELPPRMNLIASLEEGLNGVVEKINNKRISLMWTYQKQLKTWGEIMPQPNAWISEKNEEMQNSNSKENEELFALRDARRKKILELHQQDLDELLKNELNHEEPPWRTPVIKGWWHRIEAWKE